MKKPGVSLAGDAGPEQNKENANPRGWTRTSDLVVMSHAS